MPNQNALANLDIDQALADIANGVISREIAAKYGCSSSAVRHKLAKARPEEYKAAVAAQAEKWIYDSVDEFDELALDPLAIARARARGDFRLKLAGKLNPKYADKQEQSSAPQGPLISITLASGSTVQSVDNQSDKSCGLIIEAPK